MAQDGPGAEPNLFEGIGEDQPQSTGVQASGSPQEPNLFAGVGEPQAGAQGQPQGSVAPPSAPPPSGEDGENTDFLDTAQPSSPLDTAKALALGAAKGAFATKDFFVNGAGLWGSSAQEEDRSWMRQSVDQASADMQRKWGAGYSFAEGIGQVAVGLLGAGKITAAVTGLRTVGETIGAVAAFEPHAANFANLASNVPYLNGPLTQALASKPNDSDAMGYAKNVLTSLGVSAATVGTFMASAAMLRAVNSGDKMAIEAAHAQLGDALEAHQAEQDKWTATQGSNTTSSSDTGLAPPPSSSSGPAPSSSTAPSSSSSTGASSEQTTTSATATPATPATTQTSAPPKAPGFTIPDEQFNNFMASSKADQEALIKYGSWDKAIENGHVFGQEDHIPWQMISGENTPGLAQGNTALDAFIARVASATKTDADALKGGAVQTDAMNAAAVQSRVALWGQDQGALLGILQRAGSAAGQMRADMQAGLMVSQRMLQDSFTLASRIDMGDVPEFGGSQAAAKAALQERVQIAAKTFAAANSILSNSGRTVRGAQQAFRLDPMTIKNLAGLDPDSLVQILKSTGGDPRSLAKAIQPTLWQRATEGAQLFLVNNLISNPITHAVIAASNTWQTLTRPVERMAGAALTGTYDTVGQSAAKSYGYMAASIPDALRSAMQAFKMGDSIIAPHDVQAAMGAGAGGSPVSSGLGQAIAQAQFGPWDNVGHIFTNVMLAAAKAGTFPTRMVGFQDELVKQIGYRSNIQAQAFVDGAAQGLKGDDLTAFVRTKLEGAFDDYGRATNAAALQEAKVATYQNDLNPGTAGAWMQKSLSGQGHPQAIARIIIPFLRTPVNLFRQGVQLTPVLNMAQTEFRQAIMGASGDVAKAQAVGQMGMGALIMGSVGLAAYQGLITGDAPSNPKLADEAMADGWRPNSIVVPHGDGTKTYVPFDRYDPVMLPFAMAANIVSVLKAEPIANQWKSQSMLEALSVALIKQMTSKLYLQNIQSTLEMVQDPDRNFAKWGGKMAANYVPMSSLLHLVNPDPVMREADGFISSMVKNVPGFSPALPPRYDWAGDPVSVHKGLWVDTPASKANAEMERLALTQGGSMGPPSSKARGGADLREITMAGDKDPQAAGRTAYDRYQELAGHPPGGKSMREVVERIISSPSYQNSPDGDSKTPGTKLSILTPVIDGMRKAAMDRVSSDANVKQAEFAEMHRVAALRGGQNPGAPTVTNATDSFLQRLGSSFGLSSLRAPSPATPTGAGGPQQ